MSELTWSQQQAGIHFGDLTLADEMSTGVKCWRVVKTGNRRWEIVSIDADGWGRNRHGSTYTLREAKEAVGNFHRSNLARPLTPTS